MIAMTLYINENNDYFPPNPDDGNKVPGHNWVGGDAGKGARTNSTPMFSKIPNAACSFPISAKTSAFFVALPTNAWAFTMDRIREAWAKKCPRPEHFP